MNQEATFALRFIMKDFAKMRKGIEEMNKNLEKMQNNAKKASSNMNNLNNSMGKTIRTIGKFALAYFALSKIMSATFKKANETIQIDLIAQSAGVAAEKIGKLGKALRIYGGDARSAGSAYSSLTDIIGGATHGMGISEDVARVNAMYGIGFNYGNISQDALMTEIARTMHRLRGQNDQWAINQIAKAYGIDAPMANFLAEQGVNWSSEANKYKFERVSKSETQRLIESQDNLDAELAKLGNRLVPVLTKLVNVAENLLAWLEEKFGQRNPNTKKFDANGGYSQLGRDNSYLSYNEKTGEYMVLDKDLNPVYQGKNKFAAENEYGKLNYNPSWFDKHVVKPFWNSMGVETPAIDRGLERIETNVNVVVTNKSPNSIDANATATSRPVGVR